MAEDKYEGYKVLLQQKLDEKRYNHSLRVAETAAKLAILYDMNMDKAYLTGLMHDYAKNMSNDALLEIAHHGGLIINDTELLAPYLLHGPVGAYLLKQENIITDEEMLRAIALHTTGSGNMSDFDILIYLADYIEPGRTYNNVENVRAITYKSLDFGLISCLDNVLVYLLSNGGYIHPDSIAARNSVISRINKNNSN